MTYPGSHEQQEFTSVQATSRAKYWTQVATTVPGKEELASKSWRDLLLLHSIEKVGIMLSYPNTLTFKGFERNAPGVLSIISVGQLEARKHHIPSEAKFSLTIVK